jgi:hypothetical protein
LRVIAEEYGFKYEEIRPDVVNAEEIEDIWRKRN